MDRLHAKEKKVSIKRESLGTMIAVPSISMRAGNERRKMNSKGIHSNGRTDGEAEESQSQAEESSEAR